MILYSVEFVHDMKAAYPKDAFRAARFVHAALDKGESVEHELEEWADLRNNYMPHDVVSAIDEGGEALSSLRRAAQDCAVADRLLTRFRNGNHDGNWAPDS